MCYKIVYRVFSSLYEAYHLDTWNAVVFKPGDILTNVRLPHLFTVFCNNIATKGSTKLRPIPKTFHFNGEETWANN